MNKDIVVSTLNKTYCSCDCPYLIGLHPPYECHNGGKMTIVSYGINQALRSKECLALDAHAQVLKFEVNSKLNGPALNGDAFEMLTSGNMSDVVNIQSSPEGIKTPENVLLKTDESKDSDNPPEKQSASRKIWDYFKVITEGAIERGALFSDAVEEALERVAEVHGIGVNINTFCIAIQNAKPGYAVKVPKGYFDTITSAKSRPDISDSSCGSPVVGEACKLGDADRYCTKCGKRYSEADSFCHKCGNERKWSST